MVTQMQETNIIANGWLTTAEAARAVHMPVQSFRVWLCKHREVHQKLVGRTVLVNLDSVLEARRK